MVKEKKSKKENLEKLHRILDDLSLEDINDDEKKYLISLARRIEENYGLIHIKPKEKKPQISTKKETKNKNLKPRVKVHHDKIKTFSEKKTKSSLDEKIRSKDLIEIEKVESAAPEFAEIKPKEKPEDVTPKPEVSTEDIEKKPDISEWEAVEVTEEKETEESVFYCPHCGSKMDGDYKFCPECGKKTFLEELEQDIEKEEEWEKVESEEELKKAEKEKESKKKIEEDEKKEGTEESEKEKTEGKTEEDKEKKKSEEKEEKPEDTEEKPSKKIEKREETLEKDETEKSESEEKEKGMNVEEKKKTEKKKEELSDKEKESESLESKKDKKKSSKEPWTDIFSGLDYVDNKIGKILYQNGITSLEILKNTTVKKLKKIHGIRGRLAKKIKKESDKLFEKENINSDEEDSEWIAVDNEGFQVDDYTLYEKETVTKKGNKRKVRFFSKEDPDEGEPIDLPDGYEVKRNKRTNVPYLRKKK